MATFRRALTPGGTYFFTVNTYRRQRILTEPRAYTALKMAIRRVKACHPFDIEAFVLLPDHLHCLWRLPEGDMNYSLRWNLIKRQVSQAAHVDTLFAPETCHADRELTAPNVVTMPAAAAQPPTP